MAFPQVQEAKKEHTRDDLRALYDLPGNADKRFELIDGEIYEVPSGTLLHSMIIKLLWKLLVIFTDDHKLGETFGDRTEYNLPNGNTVIPDISFVAADRMPPLAERFMYLAPDLAVEVVSPSNTQDALRKKIKGYLESGTRRVWLVYPEDREILIYWQQADGITAYRTLGIGDTLSGEDVIPGFSVNVADVFPQTNTPEKQPSETE
jgi:Uma2 family endonuclease